MSPKRDRHPFDFQTRQIVAAVWHEAYARVHGSAACLYTPCPHTIDMVDLLEALSDIYPEQVEATDAALPLAN